MIGGDAGGMTAATGARKLNGDLDIVALEKSSWVSYSACGIPYLVAGDVDHVSTVIQGGDVLRWPVARSIELLVLVDTLRAAAGRG